MAGCASYRSGKHRRREMLTHLERKHRIAREAGKALLDREGPADRTDADGEAEGCDMLPSSGEPPAPKCSTCADDQCGDRGKDVPACDDHEPEKCPICGKPRAEWKGEEGPWRYGGVDYCSLPCMWATRGPTKDKQAKDLAAIPECESGTCTIGPDPVLDAPFSQQPQGPTGDTPLTPRGLRQWLVDELMVLTDRAEARGFRVETSVSWGEDLSANIVVSKEAVR